QEANPRTWDILLTTPMNALQIVVGQTLGRLVFVLALLVCSLPLFAVTQYFGGVPSSSVFLSYVVAAAAALVVGVVAVFLSVNRLAGRRAVFLFYVSVVTYIAITFVIDAFIRQRSGTEGVTVMTPLNPFLALRALVNPSGYPTPDAVDLQNMASLARLWFGSPVLAWVLVTTSLSAVLTGLSTFRVRAIGSRVMGKARTGKGDRAARTVANNPIAWREATARAGTPAKKLVRWGFVTMGMLLGLGLIAYFHASTLTPSDFRLIIQATILTELAVITLVAINSAATAISREREDGTLDLLLTTPITPKDYLGGKLRGLILFLLPLIAVPTVTLLLASGYVMMDGFGRAGGVTITQIVGSVSTDIPALLPEAGLVFPIVALPFVAFCVMIGLQWSLKSKGTLGAVVATVAVVGSVGAVVGGCGWQAAMEIPLLGAALAALNPVTTLNALMNPVAAFRDALDSSGSTLSGARTALAIGAGAGMVLYAAIIVALRASMVRTFDMTTRKLAGNA
ncbi:MAG: ABC transporter permease subunit, partial [Planctomycetota bacterium]